MNNKTEESSEVELMKLKEDVLCDIVCIQKMSQMLLDQ